MSACATEGCGKPSRTRGLCSMHYERLRNIGTFDAAHERAVNRRGRPKWDDGFGYWFTGFADGEGCFRIARSAGVGYVFTFGITLRDDDAAVLHECQWRTGLGTINFAPGRGTSNPQVKWEVRRKTDCFLLTGIFDTYHLRAKKARDYALWREGVMLWQGMPRYGTTQNVPDWTPIATLAEQLREGRQYAG